MSWWRQRKLYRNILLFLLALVLLTVLFLVRGIFFSLLLAGALTYLFNPLVDRLEYRGTPRSWGILLVYTAAAIVVAAICLYGIPRIVGQLNHLVSAIPVYTGQIQEISGRFEARFEAGLPEGMKNIIDDNINRIEQRMILLVNMAISGTINLLGQFFSLLLAPVLAFYLLRDFSRFKENFFSFMPHRWQNEAVILAGEINKVLVSYIRGYLLVSLVVGVLTGLAMFLLGVDFALILGLFAGLTEMIPYFGPFIGLLPAVSLALLESKWLALKVVIAFLVIQQLEGNIISPRLLGHRVGLHPLAVILALMVAGELFGLPGMLLAVPAAAILRILAVFFWQKLKLI